MTGPSSVENRRGGARVVLPPPLVFLLSGGLGWYLQELVALTLPLGRGARVGAALLVLAAGIGLCASTLQLFHRSGQEPEPWKPTPALIARGPYRFSRNPMYLGMTLVQVGIGLGLDRPWIVLLAVPALLVVHVTAVLPEERYLRHRFGDGYDRYMATVPRYVGRRRAPGGETAG